MKTSRNAVIFGAGLILLITLLAYIPAMRGGYVWDDETHITNNTTLRTTAGLRRIWLEPGAVPQYYPMVHTSYWIEYHLWQLQPFGYHLVNVLLHGLNSILLWLVLRSLSVPGAWLAAAIFALHPVQVESVAWITERKNVLSGLFYLASILAFIRFARLDSDLADSLPTSGSYSPTSAHSLHSWRFYWLALALYICALLSKTVTCSMPAVILLLIWWKRDRIQWGDIAVLIPFFVLGAALGLTTVWMEKNIVGAQGEAWALSLVDRFLVAGRALWFYAGKLVWPYKLTFIYPRWQIDAGIWWQYLFPLAAVAVILALWLLKSRLGKGPLVAVLFFAGTLFPALGFFDVYPMRFSFVADHFQYLASIGLIVLAVAGISTILSRLDPWKNLIGVVAFMGILSGFGVLVWQQGAIYQNIETLWADTISKNPDAWMAHNNLGLVLYKQGKLDEAIGHYYQAVRLKPNHEKAHANLGVALKEKGKLDEAIHHYYQALRLNPEFAGAHNNLGVALAGKGKLKEAIYHYYQAVRFKPNYAEAHNNLGVALAGRGKLAEAIDHFSQALHLQPDYAEAHNNLGVALAGRGKLAEAIDHFSQALHLKPNYAIAHFQLARALAKQKRTAAAIEHYQEVLRLRPDSPVVLNDLAWILATNQYPQFRNGAKAVQLAEKACAYTGYKNFSLLDTLAVAYAETARFDAALQTAQKAMELAQGAGKVEVAEKIASRMKLFQAGKPYHEN